MDFTRKYVSLILMLGSLGGLFSPVFVFGETGLNGTKSKAVSSNKIKAKKELELKLQQKKEEKLKQEKEEKLKQEKEDLNKKKKDRENKVIKELRELKEQRGKELLLSKLKGAVKKINESGGGVVNRAIAVDVFNNEDIQVIFTEMGRDSLMSLLSKIAVVADEENDTRLTDLINVYKYEVQEEDGIGYDISLKDIESGVQKDCLSYLYRKLKQKVDPDVKLTQESIKNILEEECFARDCKEVAKLHWNKNQDRLLEDLEEYSTSMHNSKLVDVISMYRNRTRRWF